MSGWRLSAFGLVGAGFFGSYCGRPVASGGRGKPARALATDCICERPGWR
ncbi:MAG: hypothetical protein M1336_02855 [Deltaproteobacteria bacterium]|nr:hypothetical protein [Deltaproteobacteria bacterium]